MTTLDTHCNTSEDLRGWLQGYGFELGKVVEDPMQEDGSESDEDENGGQAVTEEKAPGPTFHSARTDAPPSCCLAVNLLSKSVMRSKGLVLGGA